MTSQLHPFGVFCAALTPIHADLSPNQGAFVDHCRNLIAEGCTGVAMLGTTGEANSFSVAERKSLLEAALAGGISPHQLLPGTGVAAITDTVELTRHALATGVSTVVMLPPFYYKGVTDDGLFAAYAETIERIGDDRLRVVLYHIPQMSAVPIPLPVIERLRRRFPTTVVGIKDSSGDINNMLAMIERFPGFAVLTGADPLMLELLGKGGAGAITATTNIAAKDLAFVFRHFNDAGRAAEVDAAQARVVAARARVSRFAQMASLKALVAEKTGDEGWLRMRPPLMPLTQEERATLLADRALAA
jgi:4-hydroxy-tetrahydrodipicolinate synthase